MDEAQFRFEMELLGIPEAKMIELIRDCQAFAAAAGASLSVIFDAAVTVLRCYSVPEGRKAVEDELNSGPEEADFVVDPERLTDADCTTWRDGADDA